MVILAPSERLAARITSELDARSIACTTRAYSSVSATRARLGLTAMFDSRADELRRSTADFDGMTVLRKLELSSLADCGG